MTNRVILSLVMVLITAAPPLFAQIESDSVRMAWKAATNHDGRFLAVSYGHWSEEGRTIIFDANTGAERVRIPSIRGVRALLPTPDGKQFVTGNTHGEYVVVDFETGKVVRQWRQTDGTVEGFCFSPDGKHLIAGSHSRCVNVYEFGTGKRVLQFTDFRDIVYSVAVSPDGKWLATADRSGQISVLSFPSGKVRHRLNHGELKNARKPSSSGLMWSADGSKLFSGGYDETICLIDVEAGKVIKQSERYGTIDSLLATPDDRFLFTCDRTGLHRFDATSLEPVPFAGKEPIQNIVQPHRGTVTSLRWSADENQIISASWDNQARVWDATTGQCLKIFEAKKLPAKKRTAPIAQRHLIDDGIRFVTHSEDGSAIYAFTMNGQRNTLDPITLASKGKPRGLIDSINQGTAVNTGEQVFLTSFEGRLFNVVPSGWKVNRVPNTGSYSGLWSVAQSQKSGLVVVGKEDGHVAAIDTTTNKLQWEVKLADLPIASLSCSPDGKFVLATSGDYRKWREPGAAWLLNSKDGSTKKQFKDHSARTNVSLFLSDGRHFCTGSSDARLLTYDLQDLDKKPVRTRFPSGPDGICELKNGLCAVSYWGGGLSICDPGAGTIVKRLAGHPRKGTDVIIRALSLSPDHKHLVSADLNGDLFLWPVAEFTQEKTQAE